MCVGKYDDDDTKKKNTGRYRLKGDSIKERPWTNRPCIMVYLKCAKNSVLTAVVSGKLNKQQAATEVKREPLAKLTEIL